MAPSINPSYGYSTIILAVSWMETGLATVLMLMRFYTNWKIVKRFRSDWWIALANFIIMFVGQGFLTLAVTKGLGHHIGDLTMSQVSAALKWSWIYQTIAVFCIGLGKIAIIAFLLHIHGPDAKKRPWFLWFIGASTIVVNAVVIGLIWAQCNPVPKLWDEELKGNCNGRKLNQNFAYFQGSWSAFCDLALALYPITVFWHLQMKRHVKVGLCVLMGFGVLAAVASSIKTVEISTLSHEKDITWYLSNLIVWASTETWVIVIVGCVPPLRPLFLQVFKKIQSTVHASTSHTKHGHSHQSDFDKSLNFSSVAHARNKSGTHPAEVFTGTDDSKEHIMDDQGGIMLTHHIDVNYERKTSTADSEETIINRV